MINFDYVNYCPHSYASQLYTGLGKYLYNIRQSMVLCKHSERFLKLPKKYMSLHSNSRSAGSRTSEREKKINGVPLKGSLIEGEVATSHCHGGKIPDDNKPKTSLKK